MTTVRPAAGSRLDQLAGLYAAAKQAAEVAVEQLETLTTAIKVELTMAAPDAPRVDLVHAALPAALRLQAKTSWRLDTGRLKAEQPELYVRYAKQSTAWELRAVKGAE
jgi:hypothetical protein